MKENFRSKNIIQENFILYMVLFNLSLRQKLSSSMRCSCSYGRSTPPKFMEMQLLHILNQTGVSTSPLAYEKSDCSDVTLNA